MIQPDCRLYKPLFGYVLISENIGGFSHQPCKFPCSSTLRYGQDTVRGCFPMGHAKTDTHCFLQKDRISQYADIFLKKLNRRYRQSCNNNVMHIQ